MRSIATSVVTVVTALCLLVPAEAHAQIRSSVGVGLVQPLGDFGEFQDNGFTVRGQVGVSLLVASVHAQAGWTRFPGKDLENLELTNIDIFHAGAGVRVGMGIYWVGLNGAYFSGDEAEGSDGEEKGMGFFPEVGVGLGAAELVADLRVDGDQKWVGVRLAVKF